MMAANVGKAFESAFVRSAPDYLAVIRLPDPPQSFEKRSDTRFSKKNPFDYVCFDSKHRILFCVEAKTTKYRSISFEDIHGNDTQNRMVHRHQILGLMKYASFEHSKCGFLFNFRDEKNNEERTYWQSIEDFNMMTEKIGKHSANEADLILNGAVKVKGAKKRTRYTWEIGDMLDKICGE